MTRDMECAFGWVNGGLDSQNSRRIDSFTGPGSGELDETSDHRSREIGIRFTPATNLFVKVRTP